MGKEMKIISWEQGFWWEKEGTVKAGDYSFFYGKGNENHQ